MKSTERLNTAEGQEMEPRGPLPVHKAAASGLVIAAFAAVYLVWGSTYLAIRYAVESIPPFLMAGSRFFVAGAVLYGVSRWRGAAVPTRSEWRDAAIAGALLLLVGNGGVTWAERSVPSGVTALLVALTPLWIVLLDWLRPEGVRPARMVVTGLIAGFTGVALLVRGPLVMQSHAGTRWGVAAIVVASFSWACGSIFNRHACKPGSPLMTVSMQMIAGGLWMLILGLSLGETAEFSVSSVTWSSAVAWLYLTFVGALVGFTAYIWLLQVSTPARVSTYAYVNPLIAILLGCTIGREVFSRDLFLAAVLIAVAVACIVRGGARRAPPPVRLPVLKPVPCLNSDSR